MLALTSESVNVVMIGKERQNNRTVLAYNATKLRIFPLNYCQPTTITAIGYFRLPELW
jgi:hypothetical protein